jgi:hypothetical protein
MYCPVVHTLFQGAPSFRVLGEMVGLSMAAVARENADVISVRGFPPLQRAQGWGARLNKNDKDGFCVIAFYPVRIREDLWPLFSRT